MQNKDLTERLAALPPEQRAALLDRIGARLAGRRTQEPVIERRAARPERLPLSHLQEQLWFLDQLAPGQSSYNIPTVLRLTGDLDLAALRGALDDLVARHETLRTTFGAERGEPFQRIAAPSGHHLVVEDLTDLTDDKREEEGLRRVGEEVRRPFDLEAGPLFRSLLVRLAPDRHLLALTVHHICSDGWSTSVLSDDLGALYTARRTGRPADLPELAVQYADYTLWQRERLDHDRMEPHLAYWEEHLRNLPVLELPTDRPRPEALSYRSEQAFLTLPGDLLDALRRLSAEQGASLFMTLMAAFHAVLARYSGQPEIVVGTTTTGRGPAELGPLIGYFVNMVVLRGDVSGDPSFRELLSRIKAEVLEAWRHEEVPFEKVVERLAPARDTSRNPLFQVGLQLLGSATAGMEPDLPGIDVETVDVNVAGHPFDLSVTATEYPERLRLVVEYSVDLFDRPRMERMLGHLRQVLAAVAADPGLPLSRLPLLTDEERTAVLTTWQGRPLDQPTEPVHVRIARRAAEQPEATAGKAGDEILTYGQLDSRAEALAHWLRARGIGPGDVVAVAVGRELPVLTALVGVLKAGAAFVIIDPAHPRSRLEFVLGDTAAKAVLTLTRHADRLPGKGRHVLCLDRDWAETERAAQQAGPLRELADENSVAYVLYTSGSTGTPKGVVIEHHALTTFLQWLGGDFGLGPGDRLLQHMALIFDFAVGEIFTTLTTGAALVFVPESDRLSPKAVGDLLAAEEITFLCGPPAMLGRVDAGPYPALRGLVVGGEAFPADLVNRWNLPGRRFINGYGPTEAAIGCIFYECEHRVWQEQPPIGRAMPGRWAYVVDRDLNLLPPGIPGEVVVGGQGLARGYLNRPELTDEKFVADPYHPGERLYHTGDLGVWTEDGQIVFLGRIDTQVKLNGLRIELEEIESVLTGCSGVAEACVALREDTPGNKRLVAYLVPEGAGPDDEELRAYLADRLPTYMIPHQFLRLDELPLTPVGKVDRTRLPAPGAQHAEDGPASRPPRTAAERRMAEVFAEVLGVPSVSAEDTFFDLGGNSLQAARVLVRLSALTGHEISMRDFYAAPRVCDLARLLPDEPEGPGQGSGAPAAAFEAAPPGADEEALLADEVVDLERRLRAAREKLAGIRSAVIPRADASGPAPLSFAQEQLWFLEQLVPGTPTYHIPVGLRLRGVLDVPALRTALDAVVARHDALRSAFTERDGVPVQETRPAGPVPLPVTDLSEVADPEGRLDALLRNEAQAAFDLGSGLLLRARLFRMAAEDHLLCLTAHHICFDGWSAGVVVDDLSAWYTAARAGTTPDLPDLPVQYTDFARWQRRRYADGEMQRHLDHWAHVLTGAPLTELPSDRPRPAVPTFEGAQLEHRMPGDVLAAVRRLSRELNTGVFPVLLAALDVVLARCSGVDDIVVGTADAGRARPEVERVAGFFVTMLALRTRLDGDPGFGEVVRRARDTVLDALDHREAPFDKVVERVVAQRDPSRNPLFGISLDLQSGSAVDFRLEGLDTAYTDVDLGAARFDLVINAYEETDGLTFRAEYATTLFERARIEALFAHMEQVLRAGTADPAVPLSRLPLLTEDERGRLSVWGDRGAEKTPAPRTVHGRFLDQAARTPDAPAVLCGPQRLTYADLERRSRALAAALKGAGVRPGDPVAVLLDRGPHSAVALLGVLRAGAAYAPLDTQAPPARLEFQLTDLDAAAVVTDTAGERLLDRTTEAGRPRVSVDRPLPVPGQWQDGGEPGDLAFVVFTSGSTGRPKGTLIEHGMVDGFVSWMAAETGIGAGDRMLHCCSPAFDLSVAEQAVPLSVGGTSVVAPRDTVHTPGALGALMREARVGHVFTTPTVLGLAAGAELPDLKVITVAGEPCPPALVNAWHTAGRRFLNVYGPAEATIGHTWYELPGGPVDRTPPIGRPLPGRVVRVVDRHGGPVPAGVTGEIVAGGSGVSRGYLNRPELTAQRFVTGDGGERLYRTGDLGFWDHEGRLHFAGRTDHQIKLRGLRIEPGEVEALLVAHDSVAAAVVTQRDDGPEGPRLVCHLVPADPDAGVDAAELRGLLAEQLPAYMVPGAWVVLDRLPTGATGKIDRAALPAPDDARTATTGTGRQAPEGHTEKRIAALFGELLGAARMGAEDDFFTLGGSSLQAIRAVSRLNEAFPGLTEPIGIRDFYISPSITALARLVDARTGPAPDADHVGDEDWELLTRIENMTDEEAAMLLAEDDGERR
ncbi:amino acid adenylation domain-containing protein [Streptomyces griseoincarnatus]